MTDKWCEAHNFPYIILTNGTIYWQTNISCGEFQRKSSKPITKKMIWYDRCYFDFVKRTLETKGEEVLIENEENYLKAFE